MQLIKKYILIITLSISVLSCDNSLESRVKDLEDELKNQKELINSLLTQLMIQQTIIDSLYQKHIEYTDSVNMDLRSYLEMLIENQNELIQMLIDTQPITTDNYIRIDSLQICWGSSVTNFNGRVVSFPASFTENPKVFMTPYQTTQSMFGVKDITTYSAMFYTSTAASIPFSYNAFGKWK